MRLLFLILTVLTLCRPALAHEITFSQIDIHLDATTTLTVKLPLKALLQQVPPVLPAGTTDASLRHDPLGPDIQTALTTLLTTRLLLSGPDPQPLTITQMTPEADDIVATLSAPPMTGALSVQADLFPQDPLHKIFVSLYRGPTLAGQYALDHHSPGFTLSAPQRPLTEVIATFVAEGIHHIFIGPDHILFVLALILLGGTWRAQLRIITAFTLAHSLTLTLAALAIVHLPPRLTESTIALSIVVVGLHDVARLRHPSPTARDPRTLFALAFGLIHGFGFASVLTELELPRHALIWSLAAFNIGVEIGQATIVLLATPLLLALRHHAPPRIAKAATLAAASGITLGGAIWFLQRAFGING